MLFAKNKWKIGLFLSVFTVLPGQLIGKPDSDNALPKIKPFIHVFSNVNTNLNSNQTLSGFELTRSHIGLNATLAKYITGVVCYGATTPQDSGKLDRTGYIKQAYLRLHNQRLALNFGMIPLKQMALLENFWGHRYIYKSFQEQYGFGSYYDLGLTVDYSLNKDISVDFSMINGEGIFANQTDNSFKSALGITYHLGEWLVFRQYADIISKSVQQSTTSTFFGITPIKHFSIGSEFNYQWNVNFNENLDVYGYSIYSTYALSVQYAIFARFDYLTAKNINNSMTGWNAVNNGQKIIIGAEYKLMNHVRVSVNYQNWRPENAGLVDIQKLYFNMELKY